MSVTYETISGSVGSVLLVWSRIERSARDEVMRAHGCVPKSVHGAAAVLKLWESTVIADQPATSLCPLLAKALRAQLRGPLDIRNGICHGLIGISAACEIRNETAALQWEIDGEKHLIYWDELQASLGWLCKIPSAISIISNVPMIGVGSRFIDNAENREWWLTEYGLSLPNK